MVQLPDSIGQWLNSNKLEAPSTEVSLQLVILLDYIRLTPAGSTEIFTPNW